MSGAGLFGNAFFSGGLALGAIAMLVALVRQLAKLAMRRLFVEIEVREWDMVMWFGLFLANIEYGQRCRKLTTNVVNEDDGDATIVFEPGMGLHLFRYAGAWTIVSRLVDKEENVWNRREWYAVRVFGSREAATKLLEESKRYAKELLLRRHTAFISDGKGEWKRIGVGAPRELSSVILPGDTAAAVVERVQRFLTSRFWYEERGIPWRIGFGFFGPPRTGKTSFVRAIARTLNLPLYVLDLASKDFSDRDLIITLAKVPPGSIVLIEDADSHPAARRRDDDSATSAVDSSAMITLSGLLNALDGALASEGRILIITSNAPERLDTALVGEGRLDVHVHLTYATHEQAIEMFLRFFPGEQDRAFAFADALPEGAFPPAAIQEHLVARADSVERAVADAYLLARKDVRAVTREVA